MATHAGVKNSPTAALGMFASQLRGERLPKKVEFRLGELFLDYFRVASIGEAMPWSLWARAYETRLGGSGRSGILFSRRRTNPVQASFLNATYAGSSDSDDTHVGSMLHPGAIVFSAALAVAAEVGSSGAEFLSAVAVGYETMIRIGLAIQPTHFHRGFQSTATCGGFGAATAAATLLFKQPEIAQRVSESIGIVASFAGGLTQFYQSGSTIKRIHAAHATESGVAAALLAFQGFSGPIDILEGSNGFARAYADEANLNLITDGLGIDCRVLEVMVKTHSCSARVQSAVEAIFELGSHNDIGPDDIEHICVGVPSVIVGRLTLPHPVDVQAAQMSMPFSVALAVSKIREAPSGVTLDVTDYENGLANPALRAIEDRIDWNVDSDVEAATTIESVAAKVVIRLRSGSQISKFVVAPKGSPSQPISHDMCVKRFQNELGKRLPRQTCNRVVELVGGLAALESVEPIVSLLVGNEESAL